MNEQPVMERASTDVMDDSVVAGQAQAVMLAIRILRAIGRIVTGPVEMLLRPDFGTRYFDLPTMIMQFTFLQLIATASFCAKFTKAGFLHPHAPIGMGVLLLCFYGGCIYHGRRIWDRMNHMDKEAHSQYEGAAWPFYEALPKGDAWSRVRVIYEPVTVICLALTFYALHIAETITSVYLVVAGILLSTNACFYWYEGWSYVRSVRDKQEESRILQGLLKGTERVPETVGSLPVSDFIPKGTPREEQVAFIARMMNQGRTELPAEYASLLTPKEGGR